MKRYDCTKTRDYIHERNRMVKDVVDITRNPEQFGICMLPSDQRAAESIAEVQKWSDEHPEEPAALAEDGKYRMKRREALLKIFPEAVVGGLYPYANPYMLGKSYTGEVGELEKWWDEEIEVQL